MPRLIAMPQGASALMTLAVSAMMASDVGIMRVLADDDQPAPPPAAANAPSPPSPAPSSSADDPPKYYIFPITDADQPLANGYDNGPLNGYQSGPANPLGKYSAWQSGNAEVSPEPGSGYGIVSGINNNNDVLFRAGDVFRWTGRSLIWERRAWGTIFPAHYESELETDSRPGHVGLINQIVPVPTVMAPLTAFAIDDAGDVMGTSWGGLYVYRDTPGINSGLNLLLANHRVNYALHIATPAENGTFTWVPYHVGLIGNMSGNGQFIGTAQVVSGTAATAAFDARNNNSGDGGGGRIFEAPIFYSGSLENVADAVPVTENVENTFPAENTGKMIAIGDAEIDNVVFRPTGLNNKKHVIGLLGGPLQNRVPLIWEDGQWTIIPVPQGVNPFSPACINDQDDIVGNAVMASDVDPMVPKGGSVAALLHNGKLYDLNECVPNDFPFVLIQAVGINDRGVIVAIGSLTGDGSLQGLRSFLLSPAPKDAPDTGPGPTPAASQILTPSTTSGPATEMPAAATAPDGG